MKQQITSRMYKTMQFPQQFRFTSSTLMHHFRLNFVEITFHFDKNSAYYHSSVHLPEYLFQFDFIAIRSIIVYLLTLREWLKYFKPICIYFASLLQKMKKKIKSKFTWVMAVTVKRTLLSVKINSLPVMSSSAIIECTFRWDFVKIRIASLSHYRTRSQKIRQCSVTSIYSDNQNNL